MIDFPNNPALNQQFSAAGKTWQWDGTAWKLNRQEGSLELAPWQRPADWLPLPVLTPTESKFVGLLAVFNHDSNYVVLYAAGGYTVDWGDGVVEDVQGGTSCTHLYNYDDFAGTESERGYRQALVTLTPQPGAELTEFGLQAYLPDELAPFEFQSNWLDIAFSGPDTQSLDIGGKFSDDSFVMPVRLNMLEKIVIASHNLTSMDMMFYYLNSLKVVECDFSGVLSLNETFEYCSGLEQVDFVFPDAADLSYIFAYCRNLKKARIVAPNGIDFSRAFSYAEALVEAKIDSPNGTNFERTFADCTALQLVEVDTRNATSMEYIFGWCETLRKAPLLNTANVTNFSGMFASCYALEEVPLYDTSSGVDFSSMFSNCAVLKEVPLYDTSSGVDFNSMFRNCRAMKGIPTLDTASGVNFSEMFGGVGCAFLPAINTSNGVDFTAMVESSPNLVSVPQFNVMNGESFYSFAGYCFSLSKVGIRNWPVPPESIYGGWVGASYLAAFENCRLSAESLNQILLDLPVVENYQMISVSGNYGVSQLAFDPSIATAKGWTVLY
jgi:hypothetical protein